MENNLPLSPPKRILDRLTPVSPVKRHNRYRTTRRRSVSSCSKFYGSSYKTPTSSEVLDRVHKWNAEKKNRVQLKKEQLKQRMLTAQRNRNAVIEERRETARRFSEESRIWNRFKVKFDVDSVQEESVFDGTDEADPIAYRHGTGAIDLIAHHLQRHFLRRRLRQSALFKPLEDLIHSPYEEVQTLVQTHSLKSLVKEALQFYHLSNPFPSIPIENVLLTSLLLLSDHITNSENKVFEASLGSNSEEEFAGYLPDWMKGLDILNDDFMKFLTTRQLILSRRLLLRLQVCVQTSSHIHDSAHLRLLSVWREYCDLFRITQVLYLSRCLLLLCKAIDILQSGMAIESFMGCVPEYSKLRSFENRKDTLVRQLAQWKRLSEVRNVEWCFLGVGLQESVDRLSKEFEVHSRLRCEVADGGGVIPPGFSVEEWQKYRLYKFLDECLAPVGDGTLGKMKTGRDLLRNDASSQLSKVESMMVRIGMCSFQRDVQGCCSVQETVVLSFRLFGCLGIQLTNEECDMVSNGWENSEESLYFERVGKMFVKYSGVSISNVSLSLAGYLKWWRAMMNKFTLQFVDHAIESLSYGDFAYQMGLFNLKQRCPVGMTLEDYAEEIGLQQRYTAAGELRVGIPTSTLVVESILAALGHQQRQIRLPWLFGSMEDELRVLYRELEPVVGACILFVVGVCADDGMVKLTLENLVDKEKWPACYKWRTLVLLNLRLFSGVYEGCFV